MLRIALTTLFLVWQTGAITSQSIASQSIAFVQTEITGTAGAGRHFQSGGTGSSSGELLVGTIDHGSTPGEACLEFVVETPFTVLGRQRLTSELEVHDVDVPILSNVLQYSIESEPAPQCGVGVQFSYSASWDFSLVQSFAVAVPTSLDRLELWLSYMPRVCPTTSSPPFSEGFLDHEVSIVGPGLDMSWNLIDGFYFSELLSASEPLLLQPGEYTLTYLSIGGFTSATDSCCTPAVDLTLDFRFVGTEIDLAPYVTGDVQANGVVDLGDGIALLSFLFDESSTLDCVASADSNGDGSVGLADAITLFSFLFQGDVAPAFPYPDCGVNPVANPLGCESYPLCD